MNFDVDISNVERIPLLSHSDKTGNLRSFLRKIDANRVKVDILLYFVRNRSSFLTTAELAMRLGREEKRVQRAVKQLSWENIVTYVDSFGYSDLCYLDPDRLSPSLRSGLNALIMEARENEDRIYRELETDKSTPNGPGTHGDEAYSPPSQNVG